jgi:hypothetical protein
VTRRSPTGSTPRVVVKCNARRRSIPDLKVTEEGGKIPGDNLSKIAKTLLGGANRYREIFEANKDALKDPDPVRPGQKLKIPRQ